MKFRFLIAAFMLIMAGKIALGQAVASLEDKELLMGSTTTLEISVPLPNDSAKVEFPLLKEAEARNRKFIPLVNDTVELLVTHKRSLDIEGSRKWMKYFLTIQSFDSGRYELPSMEFIVAGEKVNSNPVELIVLPVKVKADDKIDDFTGVADPFELNPDPDEMEESASSVFIWWLIGVLVFLLLIAVGYIFYRKNGKIFPVSRIRPPYEVAIDKLTKLKSQDLPSKGKTKEYYTRLSDILRVYLKKQFGIKTYEKTSGEILSQVGDYEPISDYKDILKSIFETSDFVKFAKVNPSEVENARCLSEAIRFVEFSKPRMAEKLNEEKAGKGGES